MSFFTGVGEAEKDSETWSRPVLSLQSTNMHKASASSLWHTTRPSKTTLVGYKTRLALRRRLVCTRQRAKQTATERQGCIPQSQIQSVKPFFSNRGATGMNPPSHTKSGMKIVRSVKEISSKAKLSKVYTNHCVRATAITLWSEAGLSDRHICHISGHRNPNSLQHCNSRPSSTQLRKCSDVLSSALQDAKQTKQKFPGSSQPENQLQTAEVSATEVETHSRSSSSLIHGEMLGGMFNFREN